MWSTANVLQELEKTASRKLKINAKETMQIAEKLYTQGYISYPRTETNIFPKELDLANLVQMQTQSPDWGGLIRFTNICRHIYILQLDLLNLR